MDQTRFESPPGVSLFVLIAFSATLTGAFLTDIGLPKFFSFAPELSSLAACILILFLSIRRGFAPIRAAIWIVMFIIALQLLFGLLANHVQVGTAIVGARIYLRCVPFLLLPLVAIPTEKDLRNQFRLLLILGVIQLPIAVHQKLTTMSRDTTMVRYLTSGDQTFGTLMNSAILSIFLICLATVVFSAYLRNRISLKITLPILAILLFPTTINSTKATIFIIPFALLLPVFFMPGHHFRKHAVAAVAILATFLSGFITIHDYLIAPRWGYGLLDFLTMQGRVEGYLMKDADIGTTGQVGRVDSLVLPFKAFKSDPVSMTLGLGMGSITESSFGSSYTGEYYSKYGNLSGPTASRLLWETGVLGLTLVSLLILLMFDEARKIRLRDDAVGILAHSWLAIVPIMFIAMIYKDTLNHATIGILFWYYSGVVIASSAIGVKASRVLGPKGINDAEPRPL